MGYDLSSEPSDSAGRADEDEDCIQFSVECQAAAEATTLNGAGARASKKRSRYRKRASVTRCRCSICRPSTNTVRGGCGVQNRTAYLWSFRYRVPRPMTRWNGPTRVSDPELDAPTNDICSIFGVEAVAAAYGRALRATPSVLDVAGRECGSTSRSWPMRLRPTRTRRSSTGARWRPRSGANCSDS